MAGAYFIDQPSWWDRSAIFLQANANKRGLTLDLAHPRGRELLLRLMRHADVVVENFTPRVFAIVAALTQREHSGEGCLAEVPMVQAALNIAAEIGLEWSALSVQTDGKWQSLVDILALADTRQCHTLAQRRTHHDEIDEAIIDRLINCDGETIVERLVARGVAAAVVVDPRLTANHPQMAARSFVELVAHPVIGNVPLPGLPWRMTGVDRWIRRHPPLMGEHNHEILTKLAGVTPDEFADLEATGTIATRPKGS